MFFCIMRGLRYFMEEKKLIWVVLLISLFVLIVFGSAIFLYAPSKYESVATGDDLALLTEIQDAPALQKIDPDMWTRKKDMVPEFRADREELSETKKSITVVDGDEGAEGEKYIDVSDLDSDVKKQKKELPKEIAKELGVPQKSESSTEKKDNSPKVITEERKSNSAIASNAKKETKIEKKAEPKRSSKTQVENIESKKERNEEKRYTPPTVDTLYWVQTASLSSRINAEKAREKLVSYYIKAEIFTKQTSTGLTYRVRVGPFRNNTEAEYWLKNIKEIDGFGSSYISQERVRV